MTVTVGDPLTLSCTSRGSPPDTFTWRKDNDPTVLQSTSITAVNYTSTRAVFRADYSIDSVTTSDSGAYTCNVTNPIGTANATITVNVTSKCMIICGFHTSTTLTGNHFFLYFGHYFFHTPLHKLAFCGLAYSVYLFPLSSAIPSVGVVAKVIYYL